MGFAAARLAMVESQIRPNGVRDPLILNAFATLPRELFVPENQRTLAYMDEAIPIPAGGTNAPPRYLLAPMTLARMLQFASPQKGDRVLDIGGVTGYSAAILARLCGKVDALETSATLVEAMQSCVSKAGVEGVAVHEGPLPDGLESHKPFDLIFLNGAVAQEPKQLFEQLAEQGRLVAIVRNNWLGQAYLYTKVSGAVSGRVIFDAGSEVLPGFEAKPHFVF